MRIFEIIMVFLFVYAVLGIDKSLRELVNVIKDRRQR